MEGTDLKMFYMNTTKADVEADIAAMKRAAERAKTDNRKAEQEKRAQDLFVNRLVESIDKLRQDIAMYDAQLTAQTEQTRVARSALTSYKFINIIYVSSKQFNYKTLLMNV